MTHPEISWAWVSLAGEGDFKVVRPQFGVLYKYVANSDSLYRCPGDISDIRINPCSYQMNGLLQGSVGNPFTLKKMDEIQNPSQTFVLIEGSNPRMALTTNFVTPIYPQNYFRRYGWPGANHKDVGSVAVGSAISFADGHAIFWQYSDRQTGSLVGDILNNKYGPAIVGKSGPPTYTDVAMTNSPDVIQLLYWSGGPTPPGH